MTTTVEILHRPKQAGAVLIFSIDGFAAVMSAAVHVLEGLTWKKVNLSTFLKENVELVVVTYDDGPTFHFLKRGERFFFVVYSTGGSSFSEEMLLQLVELELRECLS